MHLNTHGGFLKMNALYRDNRAEASGNIQLPKKGSIWHMVRHGFQAVSVHPEWSHLNEINMTGVEATIYEDKLVEHAREVYKETHKGRSLKAENKFIEMVVNLQEHHTLKDLQRVADLVKEMYGYTATLMSVHKDEGAYDENGVFVANVHGHIRFFTLDMDNGENLYRKSISSKKMTEFQDELAKLLELKRGKPASVTKRKHMSPGEYKGMLERMETMKLEDVLKINKEVREALKINKAERKHYAELENVVNMTKKALKMDEKVLMKDFAKAINGALAKITKEGAETLANALKGYKVTQGKDGLKFERVKPANGLNVHYVANPALDASISQIGAQMVSSYQAGYQAGLNEMPKFSLEDTIKGLDDFDFDVDVAAHSLDIYTSKFKQDNPIYPLLDKISDKIEIGFNLGYKHGDHVGFWRGYNEQQAKIDVLEQELEKYKAKYGVLEQKQEIELTKKSTPTFGIDM